MIRINNLTKIYGKNKKTQCVAINDISLVLPDTGFVFIIGKSGSGKSTLLNMIGTLDTVTKGDIFIDNLNIAKLSEKKSQEYRCAYLGFIFQNFNLLEEMTVRENITLAMNLSNIVDENILSETIKEVDLEGMEEKHPNELSGGQRQRVAIARALVKNPKMLLCDEPTGNLDYKTSKQILDILKEESKQKLVIIVSHNLEDAENYADRIIELHEGKIISDKTKDETRTNYFVNEEDYVELPHHKDLTTKEVMALNEKIKTKKFEVRQNKGSFVDTLEVEQSSREINICSNHLSVKNTFKISSMFSRKNRSITWYTVLITSLFISLFYVLLMFVSFNANDALKHVVDDSISLIHISDRTVEASLSGSEIHHISDKDINKFYENGYEGKIYKLYNYGANTSLSQLKQGVYSKLQGEFSYNSLKESFGTLTCDEEYLIKKFGVDGKIVVLAGDISTASDKIILTDYMADTLIKNKFYTDTADYEGVLKKYGTRYSCVIYTGYKEKYSDIYELEAKYKSEGVNTTSYFASLNNNPRFIAFLEDVYNNYGICYIFNSDLNKANFERETTVNFRNAYYEKDGKSVYYDKPLTGSILKTLTGNDVVLSYSLYNTLFGTSYTLLSLNEFVPHTMKIYKLSENKTGEKVFEYEVNITKLSSSNQLSFDVHKALSEGMTYVYGLRFENVSQKNIIIKTSKELGYSIDDIDVFMIPVIKTILFVFEGVCYLILGLLLVFSLAHIIIFGVNSIRKNNYEIGVLKALGTKNMDIGLIFFLKILSVGFMIICASIIGMIICRYISNALLISAFERFVHLTIYNLKIIRIDVLTIFITLLLLLAISLISSIFPLVYLRKLKPLNILRENKK